MTAMPLSPHARGYACASLPPPALTPAAAGTVVERTRRHYQVEGETNFETGTLSLSGLGLKALTDDVFSGMNGLVVLRLNNNILQALPKMVFRDLINLRILHLGSNKIASLLPRAFSKLQSLQQLDIGGNLLAKIPVSAFKGLFNLQSLIISSNRLKTLPGEIFKELSRLEILDLQSNRLESLPYNVLTGLTSLRELYLQDNELPELPARMFSNLTRLQVAIFVPAPYGWASTVRLRSCTPSRTARTHARALTSVRPLSRSLIFRFSLAPFLLPLLSLPRGALSRAHWPFRCSTSSRIK